MMEFGVDVYGYDPLLSKEEIEGFGVKTFDNLGVEVDCVTIAVAHDGFKKNPFLAQVLSLERLISVLRCEGCLKRRMLGRTDFIIRSCNSEVRYITQHYLYKKQR